MHIMHLNKRMRQIMANQRNSEYSYPLGDNTSIPEYSDDPMRVIKTAAILIAGRKRNRNLCHSGYINSGQTRLKADRREDDSR